MDDRILICSGDLEPVIQTDGPLVEHIMAYAQKKHLNVVSREGNVVYLKDGFIGAYYESDLKKSEEEGGV